MRFPFAGVLVTASLAGLLFALSIPRLFADLNRQIGAQAVSGLRELGDIAPIADLDVAITALGVADQWHRDPDIKLDLGALLMAKGIRDHARGGDPAETLDRGFLVISQALALNPTSAVAWNQFARIALLTGRYDLAVGAVQRSYRVVPVDLGNAYGRLTMSLELLPVLPADTVALLASELKIEAERDLPRLARAALGAYRADEVRDLLEAAGADEDLVNRFVETSRRLLGADL